jgi:hypothetical protein
VVTSLLAASARAADGVLIVEKTTVGEKTQTHEIQIEQARMRSESTTPTGERRTVIFDGAKQVLWVIDDAKKSYSELTKADAERMASQMAGAMARLQEQLKGMPPDARAQMEKMMQGRGMPGGGPAVVEYRKVGTDKVGSWTCTKYEGLVDGKKTTELCSVDPSALGFSAADFAVTQQMAEFFGKLIPQGGERLFRLGSGGAGAGFEGVPVRTVVLGPPRITSEVLKASRERFADSTFALPSGFQKQEFGPGAPRQAP